MAASPYCPPLWPSPYLAAVGCDPDDSISYITSTTHYSNPDPSYVHSADDHLGEDVNAAIRIATSFEHTYQHRLRLAPSPCSYTGGNKSSYLSNASHMPASKKRRDLIATIKSQQETICDLMKQLAELETHTSFQPHIATSAATVRSCIQDLRSLSSTTLRDADRLVVSLESSLLSEGEVIKDMVDIIRGQLDEQKIDEHLGRSLLDSLDGIVHSPGSDAGLAGSLRDVRREPNAISSGAFSDVYKGTWQGRAVAVKKLNRFNARPYNADAFQDAFSRELLIWQKLQHPNLLPILGVDDQTVAPRLGLISPWMKAGNVQEAMRDMEEPPVLQWIRQVAQGLEYLHEKKCVHGDIRGANVLVDDDLKVQLADFGLAAFTNPTRCDRTKARWTAPELLSGTIPRPNRESDVFSFASLCFELLTRNVPYGDIDHDADVIHMVLRGERPRSADTKMPEVLRTAMQICWREDPKERPKIPAVVSSLVELDGSTNRNSLQVLRRDGDVASE